MNLEKVELFNTKRDFFSFILVCLFILSYSLLIEYNNYKNLTRFDSVILKAKVIKQYSKTKKTSTDKLKSYQVLKLKSDNGFIFYTSFKNDFPASLNKTLILEIDTSKISFYEYLTSFYSYSKVINIKSSYNFKEKLNLYLDSIHSNNYTTSIYKALYTATSLPNELQIVFSNLGVSHLLAISGFHLGVLATILYLVFRPIYTYFQDKYFPYRSYKVDSFIFISISLLAYLLFLDSPPSLLRAYVMMIVGFYLYDRGYKIISMQTLSITMIILLALFPRLFFALGFWLSIAGVFYIFLFLIHFKDLSKVNQFILIPIWVYFMMLPFSLAIFSSFSVYHPLSILWTSLFTLFYPISIFMHIIGYGDFFDYVLRSFISLGESGISISLSIEILILHILISILSINKKFMPLLYIFSLLILPGIISISF